MNKKSVWVWVVVIIVLVAAVVAYMMMHKSPTKTSTTNTTTSTSTAMVNNSLLATKASSTLGSYLAEPSGKPLYTYGGDTSGVSNCNGSCLLSWPVYSAASAPSSLPANVTVIKRSDGTSQYAYKGMPLYTFASDTGTVPTGDGVGNFHIAKP